MELLGKCIVVLIGGVIIRSLWRAGQPQRVFVVRITNGEPRAVVGVVTAAFLQRVRAVAADHGVRAGKMSSVARGRRISLEFSRQFPEGSRQQLRNWWVVSGWAAPSSHARK